MNKKEIIVPLLVIGLTFLFAGICVVVFLSNGKSKKWIARKMKIGGLLLSLTAVSCNGGSGGGVETCYVQAMINDFELDAYIGQAVEVNLDSSNVITGKIYEINGDKFSFSVFDKNESELQTGNILITDGNIDNNIENIHFKLNKELKPGNYYLKLYDVPIEVQKDSHPVRDYNLKIK